MKSFLRLAPLALVLLAALPAPLPAETVDPAEAQRREAVAAQVRANRAAREALNKEIAESAPKFDLDFPGGTPAELVTAIEKASGSPLNVIIPDEHAAVRLPPLRLSQVHTAQIFNAISEASKRLIISGSGNQRGTSEIRMLFLTKDPVASACSLWFFQIPGHVRSEPITRFFPLAYYLQSGLTVDDITTAIHTSWDMSGEAQTPSIKFHQETQLLIAVGQPEQLAVIGDVLEALKTTVLIRAETAKQAPAPGASAH